MSIDNYKSEIKKAILIRRFETRLLSLFSEGKINGTVHTCVGEELTPVFISKYLSDADWFLSNHRGHGHFIAKTGKVTDLMAEMMGRTTGISHGYGGSQHLYTQGFISNGVQGGMTPIAAGMGLAMKLSDSGRIAVSFLGDGTLGEGIIYESFNLCGIWKLPVLYVLENNHYAQSTSSQQTFSGDIRKRIEGFGLDYYSTNIWDLDQLDVTFENAIKNVRNGNPAFVEVDCYRLNSHSKGDDNRNEEEIERFRTKDILTVFEQLYPDLYSNYTKEADELLDQIVKTAEEAPKLVNVTTNQFVQNIPVSYKESEGYEKVRGNESAYKALKHFFSVTDKSVMIGEDIAYQSPYTSVPYGGAFKVSKDLSDLFPGRVINTPISESSITGVGIGLALMGYTALVEIMFGDFMTLTLDQLLQHASKFSSMYGRKVNLPLLIRTPMGGRRGYGPTHSQSIEKFFLGISDINVLAINGALLPEIVYQRIFANLTTPTLLIENKIQYTRSSFKVLDGFKLLVSDEKFPTTLYRPDTKNTDLTIVCYGGMLEIVKSVVEKLAYDDIICEIICLTQLVPLNIYPIIESVRKSKKILITEEGSDFAALGSEILSNLLKSGIHIDSTRTLGNNTVIPCALDAENALLPNEDSIIKVIKEML
ncbi:dehydrogenase E1 component subunit alpha/beta [Bacteroides cutis]|uniref:dehydrogenase E1 component subunit alpha/beta n=1 Tax=Bacteroides cutis TaxID=2024197 RepID=UPI000C758708|nr:alpha-ketoacid dehydrogenase subunit alpha/beta [Bacteroides cutis]